jgi:hypothetical protein
MKIHKAVLNPNLGLFVTEVAALAKEGWELDPAFPPGLFGYHYECQMLRDEAIVDPPAPPTRAEILAKARAAKKAKEDTTKAPDETAPPPPPAPPLSTTEPQDATEEMSEEHTQTSDEKE